MTVSVLQETSTSNAASGANLSLAFVSNNTSGSAVHVTATWGTAAADCSSFQDTHVNPYAAGVLDSANSADTQGHAQSHTDNIASGANTVQANFTNTPANRGICIKEIGGCKTSPVDGHAGQAQNGPGSGTDAIKTGNMTNVNQPALISGVTINTGTAVTPSVGTGFTLGQNGWSAIGGGTNIMTSESRRITTTGSTQNATWTAASGDFISMGMIFDESAGGATVVFRKTLSGVGGRVGSRQTQGMM